MEHTKGPWHVKMTPDIPGLRADGVEKTGIIMSDSGEWICDTGIAAWLNMRVAAANSVKRGEFDTVIEKCQANARLIAASPALLEACKSVLTYHQSGEDNPCQWLTIVLALNDAITRAEGGNHV